jgi:hypothetical protein
MLDFFTYQNSERQGHRKRMISALLEDEQLQARFGM